uniref:Retrotransposon gag domain-containing protein n=1 Tax=Knipowitschia caucasica TaxID=637954 RepID=A0AAV2KLN5_KNICA
MLLLKFLRIRVWQLHYNQLLSSLTNLSIMFPSHICLSRNTFLFIKSFTQVLQHISPGREAARALVSLHQGRHRASDYAIKFRTLAAEMTITSLCAPRKQVVMVDSGTDANLMDIDLAKDLGLGLVPLAALLVATAVDGRKTEGYWGGVMGNSQEKRH